MVPSRNKIIFTGIPSQKTISLCNQILQTHINDSSFEENKSYMFYSGKNGVNQPIVEEKWKNFIIYRQPDTFHQNDDNIRKVLYTLLYQHTKMYDTIKHNILLIGGECYFFAKWFIHTNSTFIYTDKENIYSDAITNNKNSNYVITHCNYHQVQLSTIHFDMCIINVSQSGINEHLIKQLFHIKKIFYISCNNDTLHRDINILNNHYMISKFPIYNNLYGITLTICES